MRSIRRSLTMYLFALLALTLAVVWFVIDQVTARTLAAREAAGADLLQARYEERCREERARVDKVLLDQATALGGVLQTYYFTQYETELAKSRAAIGVVPMAFGPAPFAGNPLAQAAWTPIGNFGGAFGRPNPHLWALLRTYFANPPLPDEVIQHVYGERGGNDFLQINTQAGREWRSPSLAGRELPFDPKAVDAKSEEHGKPGSEGASLIDWVIGSGTTTDGQERVRQVLLSIPHFGRTQPNALRPPRGGPGGRDDRGPGPGPFGGPPSRSLFGAWSAWAIGGGLGPPPGGFPLPSGAQPPAVPVPANEMLPRLYILCARPQAAIDTVLARFATERDDELARLTTEIREARTRLGFQVATIALVAFLAIALGGPVLVGRGLRPVGRLSDAVSRVSEKDFKLPHDGNDLAVELAPIHARLTQTLDLLQRAFSREKQAVADISHELRTPIAALLATIDVALRKPRTPEQYRSALEECRLISKQLGQLVERIMTLASLDAGNDRMLVSRTDAAELASGCVAVIRPLAAANGVTLEIQAEEPLDVDTDAGKLREVLMNLLHNAIEYNRSGGSIHLTVRRLADEAVFEVRDTGIGMTPEVRDKIFERFYRADASRHATGVHAGLGLAIVKEYVSRMGGTIAVESEPDVGSTFRVTLPAPPAQPGEPPEARGADVPVTAGI